MSATTPIYASEAAPFLGKKLPDQPYPGLRPYDPNEWMIFFGREPVIEEIISRLERQPLVFVHGSSGSGKSSLIRAGVLPRLARQHVRQSIPWRVAIMRPSGGPLWNLAQALAALEGKQDIPARVEALRDEFDVDQPNLAKIISRVEGGDRHNTCLLIDQFEEIFRYGRDTGSDEVAIFVSMIVGLLDPERGSDRTHVVITMRSEFLGQCARFPGLAAVVNRTQYLLPNLDAKGLELAIAGAAPMYGLSIELALMRRLIADASGADDELPVIQHALMRLHILAKEKGTGELTLQAYRDAGGVFHILSRHANKVVDALSASDRRAIEEVFRALTDKTADGLVIRRPARFSDLMALTEYDREKLLDLLRPFRAPDVAFITPPLAEQIADENLLNTPFDIGHEALIRRWRRLATNWVTQEYDDGLRWRSLLATAMDLPSNPEAVLGEAATDDREHWLLERRLVTRPEMLGPTDDEPSDETRKIRNRRKVWSTRYGGAADQVIALMRASRRARDKTREDRREQQRQAEESAAEQARLAERLENHRRDQQRQAKESAAEQARLAERLENQRKETKRFRIAVVIVSTLFVIATCAAIYAGWQQYEADTSTARAVQEILRADFERTKAEQRAREALDNLALFTAQAARTSMERSDHGTALALALELLPRGPSAPARLHTPEAEHILYSAFSAIHELRVFPGHDDPVRIVALSPPDDGRVLTVSQGDRHARLWERASGKLISVLEHLSPVTAAIFSEDGRRILTTSEDGTAFVWNGSASIALTGHKGSIAGGAFSPDGSLVLTRPDEADSTDDVRLWDAETGKEVFVLTGHVGRVIAAKFSPNGRQVWTASFDDSGVSSKGLVVVRIWDAANGNVISKLEIPEASDLGAAVFSPTGSHFVVTQVAGHQYNVVGIHEIATQRRISLSGHAGSVTTATYSRDGNWIVTASADGTARVWDAASGKERATLRGHEGPVTQATFSSDGKQVLTASLDRTARIWDPAIGRELAVLRGHRSPVTLAIFSASGRHILTSSDDRTVRLWQAEAKPETLTLRGHTGAVGTAVFSRDGRRILTSSADNSVRIRDATTGELLRTIPTKTAIYRAVFSPDGSRVLIGDTIPRIVDAETGREVMTLPDHDGFVETVAYSTYGSRILTVGARTARVWNSATGAEIAAFRRNDGEVGPMGVSAAAFSPDGTRLVTVGPDRVLVWEILSRRLIAKLSPQGGNWRSAEFSPDGKLLVSGSGDRTAHIWNADSGQLLWVLKGHEGAVHAATFSPEGNRVLTASEDRTARIWDVSSGRELAVIRGHQSGLWNAVFSPDGSMIATASADKTARTWRVFRTTEALVDHACSIMPRPLSREERKQFFLKEDSDDPPCNWHPDAKEEKPPYSFRGRPR